MLAVIWLFLALGFGLWPFDFQRPCITCLNGAAMLEEQEGLGFPAPGYVVDEAAGADVSSRIAKAPGLTVALDLRSGGLVQHGPARIVSLSRGPVGRNFTIGQEGASVVLRITTPGTGPNGSDPATEARFVLWPGLRRFVVATYDGDAFRIFVDGVLRQERLLAAGDLSGWEKDMTLIFGNETTGDRPWRGSLFDVAIYDRAFTPSDAAELVASDLTEDDPNRVYHLGSRCLRQTPRSQGSACHIPKTFENARPRELLSPRHRQASDIAVNAAFWLPLGLLAAPLVGWTLAGVTVGLFGLAITVELAQTALVSRTSSALDLAAALGGLGLGLWLSRRARRRNP